LFQIIENLKIKLSEHYLPYIEEGAALIWMISEQKIKEQFIIIKCYKIWYIWIKKNYSPATEAAVVVSEKITS